MTERQVLLYYRAAIRLNNQRRAEQLIDANMAFTGGKEATDHLNALLRKR